MFWLSSYKSWMKASLDNYTRLVGPIQFWNKDSDGFEHLFQKCQGLVLIYFRGIIQTSVCHKGEKQNEYDSSCNSFLH